MNKQEQLDWLARNVSEWPADSTPDVTLGWKGTFRNVDPSYIRKGNDGSGFAVKHSEWQGRRSELINKPSWDDAPEWANYVCQADSGRWYWCKHEQKITNEGGWD